MLATGKHCYPDSLRYSPGEGIAALCAAVTKRIDKPEFDTAYKQKLPLG